MPFLTHIQFDKSDVSKQQLESLANEGVLRLEDKATWMQIKGIQNEDMMIRLAKELRISPLWLYQSVRLGQRPRVEHIGNSVLIVVQVPRYYPKQYQYATEQLALVMSENDLLSFQSVETDLIEGVEKLLENEQNPLRRGGIPYLVCALLDTCLEQYNQMILHLKKQIGQLQVEADLGKAVVLSQQVSGVRQHCVNVQQYLQPFQMVLNRTKDVLPDACHPYLQQLQDLALYFLEQLKLQFILLDDLMDSHILTQSHQTQKSVGTLSKVVWGSVLLTIVVTLIGGYVYLKTQGISIPLWGMGIVLLTLVALGTTFLFSKKEWT